MRRLECRQRTNSDVWIHQVSSFADFFIKLRHYTVIGKQLFISNDRNRVRWVVLGLLQDGACTDLFENFRENSLKRNLSNDTTVSPPLFSLVNTRVSDPDPYPDPHSNCGSGSGSRRAKMTPKQRKKSRIFMFWSAGCSLLRADGFTCSLGALYWGLGISKKQFLIKKIKSKFPALIFFQFYVTKPWIRNPDPQSGSAIRKNAGSGSALNQCGSETLVNTFKLQ